MTYKLNQDLVNKLTTDSIIYANGIPYTFQYHMGATYKLIKIYKNKVGVVLSAQNIPQLVAEYFKDFPDKVTYDSQPLFTKESRKIVPGTKLTIHGETYTVIKDFVNRNLKLLNRHYMIMSDDQSKFIDEDKFYEYYRFTNPKIEWPT